MNDRSPPSPEEIQREFEDFVRNRFGGRVQVVPMGGGQANQQKVDDTASSKKSKVGTHTFEFEYKPKDIKTHLDRFVIKQDEAKKALAIAVCDHYNHVARRNSGSQIDYAKQNVLVLGPTGVGKTYLVKQIAKLIGVPFVKADATRFSETGYVGANVDDLVRDLAAQAGGNLQIAQYGIVYIDEIDKLASGAPSGHRDVSGRGVQFGLLKLMEETDVDLTSGNDMRSQLQAFMEYQQKGKLESKVINTRHILFIVSGAFTGLAEIIRRRLNTNAIGFSGQERMDDQKIIHAAQTQDFVEYGFEPEFVGRLPIRVACEDLTADDLFSILTSSEGSIIRQYEESFRAFGIDIEFTEGALRKIAERAAIMRTGARALMSVCEEILRDYKFELPSSSVGSFVVTEDVVQDPAGNLAKLLNDRERIRTSQALRAIRRYEEAFSQKHNMQIRFTAEDELIRLADARNLEIAALCDQLLVSYEHGLKLIQQNTGVSSFNLGADVLADPQRALEKMIRDSYHRPQS
jgi:endopeptidase Clp ATP-binding regulatory subunit ClpX